MATAYSMLRIVIVIGRKILQSIIGSIGWDTIDNFPIINRMYIKTFSSFTIVIETPRYIIINFIEFLIFIFI